MNAIGLPVDFEEGLVVTASQPDPPFSVILWLLSARLPPTTLGRRVLQLLGRKDVSLSN